MTLKQSFAWWSFQQKKDPVGDLLDFAASIGFNGVDFLDPEHWERAKALGLQLVIIDGHEKIEVGFNDTNNHAQLAEEVRRNLDIAVENGVLNLALASGDWNGPPHDGIAACIDGIAPLAIEAEAANVGLLLEPLNSKIDHHGHECNSTAWAVAVLDGVGSPALQVLYDVYHMQIMEGDLLRTMATNFHCIGHVHTAGVPGRGELNDDQEINWKAIARFMEDRHYPGFIGHELIPKGSPAAALKEAFDIFDAV
ncbi:MAG: TIM barrel protein [Mycobacterium sp.]|uniref:TIM barrel protein n=1 Tax=Mycobacterium sp. TaxID=1785 RepID=UPI003F9B3D91